LDVIDDPPIPVVNPPVITFVLPPGRGCSVHR
jgi:hypothetical protein